MDEFVPLTVFSSSSTRTSDRSPGWQRSLASAIRDGASLLRELRLSSLDVPLSPEAAAEFPCLVPRSFLERMRPGDPRDPLLLQVLPVADEQLPVPGFVTDAVDDQAARRAPGLIHKYEGRVLLIAAGACAVHCRYCFRRHYPYHDEPKTLADWEPALAEIAGDPTIREVILSGGDPLLLPDSRLAALFTRLEAMPHLKRLRIHSRLPIVLPDRVSPELIALLRASRLQPIMVVHANHPAEVAADCADALQLLVRSGIPTLNQAVLLRGINDDADTLAELSLQLVDLGVMPYYLNQLDRVSGTAHFEVPAERGLELLEQLRTRLPGYALPRYVREVAGAAAKLPVR
ncbi:MAG: EF-P beta-lysylation protein EpmB [Planctomycetota bacterium]|nr:MAG: EF-P beta-lysylation protein EpmB [Planctomycetota bacterium]